MDGNLYEVYKVPHFVPGRNGMEDIVLVGESTFKGKPRYWGYSVSMPKLWRYRKKNDVLCRDDEVAFDDPTIVQMMRNCEIAFLAGLVLAMHNRIDLAPLARQSIMTAA